MMKLDYKNIIIGALGIIVIYLLFANPSCTRTAPERKQAKQVVKDVATLDKSLTKVVDSLKLQIGKKEAANDSLQRQRDEINDKFRKLVAASRRQSGATAKVVTDTVFLPSDPAPTPEDYLPKLLEYAQQADSLCNEQLAGKDSVITNFRKIVAVNDSLLNSYRKVTDDLAAINKSLVRKNRNTKAIGWLWKAAGVAAAYLFITK